MLSIHDGMLIPLGLIAGALTTLAGLGGGLMLVATLSLLYDPRLALAITAPALMVGNLHRAVLYRHHINRGVAARVGAAGFVAALVVGFYALRCPPWVLRVLLLAATSFALARAAKLVSVTIDKRWLVPSGVVIGAMTATSGGGPALLAPTLLAAGLTGEAYVSTGAACALAVHVARVLAYGASGFMDRTTLTRAVLLAVCVLAGNSIGAALRPHATSATLGRVEIGALVLVVALSMWSFGG